MNWQYRTILFEYQKDGLLGDRYIDDEEVEATLNEQGQSGWELVSVTQIKDGLLAFCKRPEKKVSVKQQPLHQGVDNSKQQPVQSRVQKVVTAEGLQQKEKEHIIRLEKERQETMKRQEQDLIGGIKIR